MPITYPYKDTEYLIFMFNYENVSFVNLIRINEYEQHKDNTLILLVHQNSG